MTLNMMLDNAAPEAIAGALTQQHPGLFFTMVEQASVAISLTDASARIIYANPAFCRQTGYSLAQLLNQNPRLLASSQTPREIYQEMWHTLLQRQPWRGQLINQRRDGGLYLVEIDITPVLSPQGELEHYLAMQRDISVSYTLEQRLRNHMTLMEAVLNNIPAAVVVVDEQDRVVMDNLAYKTFCADCGGRELLTELQVSPGRMTPGVEQILPVIQLNCPINMLAAARRLNGESSGNVALEAAWREGEEAMARLQRCRPSLELESPAVWPLQPFFDDLCALYRTRFDPEGLQLDMASPHLIGFGQRTQLLACLSLWLDRTLALAAELPSVPLAMQLYAEENDGWLALYLTDNVPLLQVRYAHSPDALNSPGKGMELRLIQTLVAHHRGAIELASRPQGGTCLTLRFPLFNTLTGGEA